VGVLEPRLVVLENVRGHLWGHPISAPASSSLPTPRETRGGSATETVALLPTPRTNEANGTGDHGTGDHGTGGPDLRTLVDSLLPTPTSRDHKGRNDTTCLPGAIHYPPTPTVQASKHAVPTPYERERYKAGGLDAYNLWVVIPMLFDGDPTDPPSPDGKDSPDRLPLPPSTGD